MAANRKMKAFELQPLVTADNMEQLLRTTRVTKAWEVTLDLFEMYMATADSLLGNGFWCEAITAITAAHIQLVTFESEEQFSAADLLPKRVSQEILVAMGQALRERQCLEVEYSNDMTDGTQIAAAAQTQAQLNTVKTRLRMLLQQQQQQLVEMNDDDVDDDDSYRKACNLIDDVDPWDAPFWNSNRHRLSKATDGELNTLFDHVSTKAQDFINAVLPVHRGAFQGNMQCVICEPADMDPPQVNMQLYGHSLCQQHRVQWNNKSGNKGCPLCGEAKIISGVCKGFPCATTSGSDGTSAMEHLRQGPEQQHHNLIDKGVKVAVISEDIKYGLTLGGVEILKTGSHDKIVVFSQYQRQLNVLAEDLRNNGVVFEKPTGKGDKRWSNPIDRFNTYEDCRALLLPIRACGRGLNLTQAAAVIFMEPVTDNLRKLHNNELHLPTLFELYKLRMCCKSSHSSMRLDLMPLKGYNSLCFRVHHCAMCNE
eukprot:9589-Heterococcus_DN1.PRE.2